MKYTDILKSGPKPKAGDVKFIAGIEFVYVPAGKYYRQDSNEPFKDFDEQIKAFWMTKYEVTLGEYLKLCYERNWNLPKNRSNISFSSKYPVNLGIDHDYARSFCKLFGEKHGVETVLPKPEEWEYAARAGTTTDFYWGNGKAEDYAWFGDNSGEKHHPVGQKKPNAFGLYDIIGNAWEWCEPFILRGGSVISRKEGLKYDVTQTIDDYQIPGEDREEAYKWLNEAGTSFRMIIRVPD
ncbi:MAG TPA: formylglycine-generating enzyme family protein [Spirochaetota bacterium]|nr:formylglycine-generating enzyme family protein [Spirochaetota bacterium]